MYYCLECSLSSISVLCDIMCLNYLKCQLICICPCSLSTNQIYVEYVDIVDRLLFAKVKVLMLIKNYLISKPS